MKPPQQNTTQENRSSANRNKRIQKQGSRTKRYGTRKQNTRTFETKKSWGTNANTGNMGRKQNKHDRPMSKSHRKTNKIMDT